MNCNICLFVVFKKKKMRSHYVALAVPGTHYIGQASLQLPEIYTSASDSRVLGLKACYITPGFTLGSFVVVVLDFLF